MIKLTRKNFNVALTEQLENNQPYHLLKLISMNILQVKKYYFLMKSK